MSIETFQEGSSMRIVYVIEEEDERNVPLDCSGAETLVLKNVFAEAVFPLADFMAGQLKSLTTVVIAGSTIIDPDLEELLISEQVRVIRGTAW